MVLHTPLNLTLTFLIITKKLISIRKQSKAIKYGSFKPLHLNHPNHRILCFERQFEEDRVITVLNASEKTARIDLDLPHGKWKNELTGQIFQTISTSTPKIQLTIESYSGVVLRKIPN
jgi:maltooligosyltrehalose synthase